VEHEDASPEAHGVHHPERVTPMVGHDLEDARSEPLQRFRRHVLFAHLRQEQGVADLFLDTCGKRLQCPQRIAEPDDWLQGAGHETQYAICGMLPRSDPEATVARMKISDRSRDAARDP
jgi:hypothetical protein